jgi:diguanylate cyclase (GGDEF)-like protein
MEAWEEVLNRAGGITYVDIPTGHGRTYALNELRKVVKDKCLYSLYYSPLTGIGQLLYDLLTEATEDFLTDFPEHGPVIRKYLHSRFFPALDKFKPFKPITLGQEQTLLLNAMIDLVRAAGIKYWFIDDWLQDDYNYIFSAVLPELVSATNISIIVTGENFPKEIAENVISFESLQPMLGFGCAKNFCQSFGKNEYDSDRLVKEAEGNWHELIFLCRTHGDNLQDAVDLAVANLPEGALNLLFSFAVLAERNSDLIKDILLKLFHISNVKALDELERTHLLFWEAPLYRFPSSRVREMVRKLVPEERQRQIAESVADALTEIGYSDYWGRIAERYRALGSRKKEAYALLMQLRQEKGTLESLKVIERLDQLGVQGDGYKRLKSLCLYWQNDLDGAVETLSSIKNANLVDQANLIRFLSYGGRLTDAEAIVRQVREKIDVLYDSLFFPRIAGDLILPDVLKGNYEKGLEQVEGFLDVITSSHRYLREHLGAFYNSLGVMLSYNGRLYAAFDAFQRGLEIMESLDYSEIHLRILVNLSDTALDVEGPSASFRYVNAAFRSTAPCNLSLRAVALSNYCATYFQFMGLPETALNELMAIMAVADHKTKFDVGETSAVIYWLSQDTDRAKKVLSLMNPENAEERFRLDLLNAAVNNSPQVPFDTKQSVSSTYPIYLLLWLFRQEHDSLRKIDLFTSDRPILLFFRAFRQGDTVENLVSLAVRAERGWYLADAMFIYELLSTLIDGDEKVAFLEESLRLALVLGLEKKASSLRESIHSLGMSLTHSMNLQMLEKSLLSLPLEEATIGGFINYLGNILGHFYGNYLLSLSWGEQSFRIGKERINGFSMNMYLPPFFGTLTVENGTIADTLALKAILLAMEKIWSTRYGTNDALTGLLNRNFGVEVLSRLWAGYDRSARSFSVIFFDVDDLKVINDTLGHPVGDQALRQVSEALAKHMRQSDFAVRWGGDEFLAILMQGEKEAALRVAERIEIELKNSPLPLSVSYGIVEAKEVNSLEELLSEADTRMYTQKRTRKSHRG